MSPRWALLAPAIAVASACSSLITATTTTTIATTAASSTTTAAPTTTTTPTYTVEGALPDGRRYLVSGLKGPEPIEGIFVLVAAQLGLTVYPVGNTHIWTTVERYDSPTWQGDLLLLPAGEWLVWTDVYDDLLEALGPEAHEIIQNGIRVHLVNGMPALDLDTPFFFPDDADYPFQMEVMYQTFFVRRGCNPHPEAVCSADGLLHAIPRHLSEGPPLPPSFSIESDASQDLG
jgi:hypothetical protein